VYRASDPLLSQTYTVLELTKALLTREKFNRRNDWRIRVTMIVVVSQINDMIVLYYEISIISAYFK